MKEILEEWKNQILSCEHEKTRFQDLLNITECDLIDSFEMVMEKYTRLVADKVGCSHECLFWFWLDNEMGKNKLKAGVNKMKKIKNIDDLVELINLHKESEKV